MKSSYLIWSLGETLGVDFAGEVVVAEERSLQFWKIAWRMHQQSPLLLHEGRGGANICFSLHLTLRLHCTFLNHFRHITCKK